VALKVGVHRTFVRRLERGESSVTVEALAGNLGGVRSVAERVLLAFLEGGQAADAEARLAGASHLLSTRTISNL